MALFGGEKKGSGAVSNDTPVNQVFQLRQQGMTNSQIVQQLQRSGFKSHQIFDAMNQADMQNAGPLADPDVQEPQPAFMQQAPPEQPQYEPQPQPASPAEQQAESASQEQVEELVEQIIDEKWNELLKNINKIIEWKNAVENRVSSLEQRYKELKTSFDALNQGILEKVGEYDQHVTEVGTSIKAMENVFQKVLPTLTDNVNELSRITKNIKDQPPRKQS